MKVTFVVGAGASYNFGFPTGLELIEDIESLLSDDNLDFTNAERYDMSDYISSLSRLSREKDRFNGNKYCVELILDNYTERNKLEKIKAFREALGKSGTLSIDLFLRENKSFGYLGRLCIATIISAYETQFKQAYHTRRTSLKSRVEFDGEWIRLLWNQHLRNQGFSTQTISHEFQIFNYDRCVQYLLINMASYSKAMNMEEAIEYVKENFQFVHIYGSLGNIFDSNLDVQDFGNIPDTKAIDTRANSIFVMEDERRPDIDIDPIFYKEIKKRREASAKTIQTSSYVLFIGFSYDLVNLKELLFTDGFFETSSAKSLGTSFGLKTGEKQAVISEFKDYYNKSRYRLMDKPIQLVDEDCRNFLREIRLT